MRQEKGSKRRAKTKLRLSRQHAKLRNLHKDFCHKTSRTIVDAPAIVKRLREPQAQSDAPAEAEAGREREVHAE